MGIKTTRPQAGETGKRVERAARAALTAAAALWHSTMLPVHFTVGGAAKYDYAPRTVKYMRRKARVAKHQRPLVSPDRQHGGDSERAAKNDFSIRSTVIAGHLAGVVAMHMPSYFFKHPTGGDTFIDKVGELTRTTPDEEERLRDVFERRFSAELGSNLRIA